MTIAPLGRNFRGAGARQRVSKQRMCYCCKECELIAVMLIIFQFFPQSRIIDYKGLCFHLQINLPLMLIED